MRDIESREDLTHVLTAFYARAFEDDLIGPFFTEVAQLDLDAHLPVITDFWESILFGSVRYQGNVMHKHLVMDKTKIMKQAHFDRWLDLFSNALTAHHAGMKTDEMLERAKLIAVTMAYKIEAFRNTN